MPGASEQTKRVKVLNLVPSAAAVTALVALARADTVLLWDPTNRTLIAANIVGTMPWTQRP